MTPEVNIPSSTEHLILETISVTISDSHSENRYDISACSLLTSGKT